MRLRSAYASTNGFQQFPACFGHFRNRLIKRFLVSLGRLLEPANLPHKLQRGRVELLGRSRLLRIAQSFDTPAHS